MLEMLKEMKGAIEWYKENCTPIENTRNNDEIFFNMSTNLILQSEQLIKQATEL